MNAIAALAGFSPLNIGPMELIIVLAILLIVFGPKKLPALGRAIGSSIKEFGEGMKGLSKPDEESDAGNAGDASENAKGDLDPKPAESADHGEDETSSANPEKASS